MPSRILYIYDTSSQTDSELCQDLSRWVYSLYRQNSHTTRWHTILAGGDLESERRRHFQQAELIFLLISTDFLASDVCVEEAGEALLQAQRGARVVPILLRPIADWPSLPISSLQPLPRNGRPITQWNDREAAWADVTVEVKLLLEQIAAPSGKSAEPRGASKGPSGFGLPKGAPETIKDRADASPLPQNPTTGRPLRYRSFEVVRQLGRGGSSSIYEVRNDRTSKRAALKVFDDGTFLDRGRSRLMALVEARATIRAAHPNVVDVYDLDETSEGTPLIIMELLEGYPLPDDAALPVPIALPLFGQIASAIHIAHGRGVVHGDLKPYNMIMVPDPSAPAGCQVKIFDFGIGRIEGEESIWDDRLNWIGTPHYTAPEVFRGEMISTKSDVYTLGVTFYQLLAGRTPYEFAGHDMSQLAKLISNINPPAVGSIAAAVPDELVALVHSMLARDPSKRPDMKSVLASIIELHKEIR